jgi:hypothetical protein
MTVAGQPRFDLFRTSFDIPERGQVAGYAVVTATHKITFLPPVGWTADANASSQEVVLTHVDSRAAVLFRISNSTGESVLPPKPATGETEADAAAKASATRRDQLRERVKQRFPNTRITHEFDCFADGQPGAAADLEQAADDATGTALRVAVVVLPAGVAEFQLSAPSGRIEDAHYGLACLMATLRVSPLNGEVARPALPGAGR